MISSARGGAWSCSTALRRALVSMVVVTVGGCTGGGTSESEAFETPGAESVQAALASGVVLEAELDPMAGSIRYPIDAFLPTRDDSETLAAAVQIEIAACAAERGVHFLVPMRPTPAEYDQSTLDGPWTVAQAERFAFVEPMTDADLRSNGIVGAPEESASAEEPRGVTLGDIPLDSPQRETVTECAGTVSHSDQFDAAQSPRGPWLDQKSDAAGDAQRSPEAVALREELRACYEREGIAVDAEAFDSGLLGQTAGVAGADPARIDATQITMALASVGCKDQIRYTERAAALIAAAQAPVVVAYLDELRAVADDLDSAVAEAERIVTSHADLTTSW